MRITYTTDFSLLTDVIEGRRVSLLPSLFFSIGMCSGDFHPVLVIEGQYFLPTLCIFVTLFNYVSMLDRLTVDFTREMNSILNYSPVLETQWVWPLL